MQGDTHEAFNNSYLELRQKAGILSDDVHADDSDKRLKGVKNWLDSSASGKWIMIVDNLNEIDSHLGKYLPVIRGAILYTTRDGRLGGNLTYVAPGACVNINAMSDAEGIEMFSKLLDIEGYPSPFHMGDTLELLRNLEMLPLAIAQAAAYIRETRVKISTYVKMFKECERNQHELLDRPLPSSNQDSKRHGPRAVMATWTLTIGKLREKSPDSVQLLEFMSFLSPDGIPEALLRGIPLLKNESDVRFNEAFAPLLNFSLIYRLESSNYRLHRLVGLCIRRWMDSEELPRRRDELLEALFGLLIDSFPKDKLGNHAQCQHLAAHAATALRHSSHGYRLLGSGLRLLDSLGSVLDNSGDAKGALAWYQRALDGYEKTLGKDHSSTLRTVNNMAIVFRGQGDHDKALVWHQRALYGYEKTLGKDHLDTLNTVHNMAFVFERKGEYDKALVWYRRALDGYEKTLGKDHPSTLKTVNNMAIVFRGQGDHGKALVWYQRALDGYEKTLGKDHPSTLKTVNNMAIVFDGQGYHGTSGHLTAMRRPSEKTTPTLTISSAIWPGFLMGSGTIAVPAST